MLCFVLCLAKDFGLAVKAGFSTYLAPSGFDFAGCRVP